MHPRAKQNRTCPRLLYISLLWDWEKELDREAQDRKKLRGLSQFPEAFRPSLGRGYKLSRGETNGLGALVKTRFLQPLEVFGAEATTPAAPVQHILSRTYLPG